MNKLSALESLQSLQQGFIHSGRWGDAVDALDTHLRTLLKGANMQHFHVDSIQCDSRDEGLLMGGWNSDFDTSSDTDSDIAQH